ncbi:MAG TPA: hypothetical protein DIC23_09345 [Planctomycetaceae bacterium]|nr:hypothetical protein [Planctomycetaceae bacterium]
MKRTLQGLLVLTLAVVLAMPAMAAEEKKKKKKKGRKAPAAVKVPKGIVLTADQKTKVAAINKEFAPKLVEVNKKAGTIITAEQRKARNAAAKKAKADGVKGKAARAAINAAAKITPEQKKKLAELNKARQAVIKAARAKFVEILTAEQKAKLPKPKGKKKKKKKKKDA